MGRVLSRALEAAGLAELAGQLSSGNALTAEQFAQLGDVDLLLVAGLADAVRAQFHGDEVQILSSRELQGSSCLLFDRMVTAGGATGAELLRELALLRLMTPGHVGIAVSLETIGLELAQTALVFGADTLVGDLGSSRTLPLLDGPSARRRELEGLVARSGRRARFATPAPVALELESAR
jgi:hypothetical protein